MSEDLSVVLWAQRVREAHGEGVEAPRAGDGRPSRDAVRSGRKHLVRAKTLESRRSLPMVQEVGQDDLPPRPRTRNECLTTERPCPWVACRHHLYLDVSSSGAIKLNFPDLEVWELPESCALDVAERGGLPGSGQGEGVILEEVASVMNLTRERIRQIEVRGIASMLRADRRGTKALSQYAEEEGLGATPARRFPAVAEDDELEDDQDG